MTFKLGDLWEGHRRKYLVIVVGEIRLWGDNASDLGSRSEGRPIRLLGVTQATAFMRWSVLTQSLRENAASSCAFQLAADLDVKASPHSPTPQRSLNVVSAFNIYL
jgi:hypothetical protein